MLFRALGIQIKCVLCHPECGFLLLLFVVFFLSYFQLLGGDREKALVGAKSSGHCS